MRMPLGFIVCSAFDREVRAIQSLPEFQDARFKSVLVRCDQAQGEWRRLEEACEEMGATSSFVSLVGGYCLAAIGRACGPEGACRIARRSHCAEWLLDKDVADRFVREGALLVLPGWVKDWEEHVEARWPSDPKSARAFFRELASKIVVLDTGVHPNLDADARAFARFLKLPFGSHPVGLGHFRLSLGELVQTWRRELDLIQSEDRLAAYERRMADFARMGHLLDTVVAAKSAADVQSGVQEVFRILLSPREVIFHRAEALAAPSFPEGSPLDRIVNLNADYAWSEDRDALFLRIAIDRELLGVLEVHGLENGGRRGHALDIALGLARIAAVALMNARNLAALEDACGRARAAEEALRVGEEKMATVFSYPLGLYRISPEGRIVDATPTLARMLDYPDVFSLKAVNFWDLQKDPHEHETWRATLDHDSYVHIFEAQFRRRGGTLFWAKNSARAAKDAYGRVLYYDGVLEDISAKREIEEEHSWELQVQASVGAVSERLLSPTPIEEMSALVRDHARRLTSSATALVGYVDERTGRLVPASATEDVRTMIRDHPEAAASLHSASSIWASVVKERKVLLMNSLSLDPRVSGPPSWHAPVHHLLIVPAVMSGSLVGLIALANPPNPYLERDQKAIERLAALYAVAVQRTRAEEELRELSLVDELTKLYNRRGFMTLGEQQLKVGLRTGKGLSLFYIDLDDLKKINDALGHDQGDAALVETAEVLREVFRDSDIIARVGGDEFVVLAIDTSGGTTDSLLRRLQDRVQARNARRDRPYRLSISLGVSRFDPGAPCALSELVSRADRLMYRDKSGKKLDEAAA